MQLVGVRYGLDTSIKSNEWDSKRPQKDDEFLHSRPSCYFSVTRTTHSRSLTCMLVNLQAVLIRLIIHT